MQISHCANKLTVVLNSQNSLTLSLYPELKDNTTADSVRAATLKCPQMLDALLVCLTGLFSQLLEAGKVLLHTKYNF